MPYIKDRNGNNVLYTNEHDCDRKYYSIQTGDYVGRQELDNTCTDKNGNKVGYISSDGVFYDNLGNPHYKNS